MGLFYYRVFIFLLKTFKHNENVVIIFSIFQLSQELYLYF